MAVYSAIPLRGLAKTPLLGGHPATLQLPIGRVEEPVAEQLDIESSRPIPVGKWMTQFGRPFPTALTAARLHLISARKRG